MAEKHGALMRFQTAVLQVFRWDDIVDGKVTGENCALRTAQRLKVGFGDVCGEEVCREGPPRNEHINAIAFAKKFDRISGGKRHGSKNQSTD
jgi:hypothetical protein